MADMEAVAESQDNYSTVDIDNDLEIEVVDDRPEEDRRPLASEDELAASEKEVTEDDLLEEVGERTKQRIKTLTWQRHEERRHKEEAQRLAEEAVRHTERLSKENQRLMNLIQESQKTITDQASKRADTAIAAAEDRLRLAHEEGDAAKIASAQKELTNALMAKSFAPNVARRMVQQWEETHPQEQELAQQPQQNVEVPQPDEKALKWQERNPWFGQDKIMTSTAYGIHEKLVMEEGVDPDTEEYYNQLDAEMRKIFPGRFEGTSRNAQEDVIDISSQANSPRRASTVVAPATRNNGARPPRTIKLTATEVRLAKRLGLTNEQYAMQKLKEQNR